MTTLRNALFLAACFLALAGRAQTITYENLEKFIPGEYACDPDPSFRYNAERLVITDDARGRHVSLQWLNRHTGERKVYEWNHWEIKPLTKGTLSRGHFLLSQPATKDTPDNVSANYRQLSPEKWTLDLAPVSDGNNNYVARRVSPLPTFGEPAPVVEEPDDDFVDLTPEPQRPVIHTQPLTQTEAQRLMLGTWDVRDVYDNPRYQLTILNETSRRIFDLQGKGSQTGTHLQYTSWSVTMPRPNAVEGTFHVLNMPKGLNTSYDYRNLTATIFEIEIDGEWLIARKVAASESATPAQPAATQKPATPTVQKPATPTVQIPATPVVQKPTTPTVQKPATPTTQQQKPKQQDATPPPPKQQGTVSGTILGRPVIVTANTNK